MLKNTIQSILEKRKKLHINDPAIEIYWNKLAEALGQNESQTIEFLKQCKEEDVLWLSEVFEDIAEKLQSSLFIKALENLQAKYPNLDLRSSIDIAKKHSNLTQ